MYVFMYVCITEPLCYYTAENNTVSTTLQKNEFKK